ncbi:MAG: nucleotidyltransferase domain-containing protein [Planctomycetes bacterium]|nr:nucleotidyltransferase domain-containing protein [Planctomycetota bacterium]
MENKREELSRVGERFNVRRLELFGSAADGRFDPATSDLDFLVELLPLEAGGHFNAYFGFLDALADLFGRSVDLVMTRAIKNPYFLKAANRSRTVLYAA